jgi:hypothetical protein
MDGFGSDRKMAAMQGSHLVDRELARRAVELAVPLFERAMQDKDLGDSGFLHIVVMDPGLGPGECPFEAAILYEHSIGDRSAWDADYAAYARAKAEVSWRHQRDSHALQALAPQRLRPGETTLWGSVCLDGIVVGVSGAFPSFDEAWSGVVAMCLRGLAKQRAERTGGTLSLG